MDAGFADRGLEPPPARSGPAGARLSHALQVVRPGSAEVVPSSTEDEPGPRPEPPAVATADESSTDQSYAPSAPVIDLTPDEPVVTIDTMEAFMNRSEWSESAQGWVHGHHGALEWHPPLTSSSAFERWIGDTPLGHISVDVLITAAPTAASIAAARAEATTELLSETLRRGGHGVTSVQHAITQLEAGVLVTVSGDAATLRNRP